MRPPRALTRLWILVLGLAALAGSGCGATKEDVVRLESTTQDQHAQVRRELAAMRQSLDQLATAIRQIRADIQASLDEVNNRMGIVESLMRDNEQMFQRFQRRVQEAQLREREVETIGTADTTAGAAADIVPGGEGDGEEPPGTAAPDAPGAPGAAAEPAAPSEIDLYNGALSDYQAGRYDLALAGFREYLRLYPDGASPDNAQFWIGKIHLDQEQYDAAVRELERLLGAFPETDKAAQATFYLGNAYRALGREDRAREYYRDVIERYPASQESQLARRELDR